jgi:hypothetical protein
MKKIFAVLTMTMVSSAFAGGGVTTEFERERQTQSPNTMSNTIKVAPYYKFDNGVKADIMFAGARDDGSVAGNNNPIENQIEARVQKMFEVLPGTKLGARVSIGEMFNGTNTAGKTVDFTYYTVEPKASYALTKDLSINAAWRYRNGTSAADNYQTRTWKFGPDYALTKQDEIGARYLIKRGDTNSNGVELTYSRAF